MASFCATLPSEMVGTKRTGRRAVEKGGERTICTSHVERLNGTQGVFLRRLNRLTLCFSKKLRNLEASFAMFAALLQLLLANQKAGQNRPAPLDACHEQWAGGPSLLDI